MDRDFVRETGVVFAVSFCPVQGVVGLENNLAGIETIDRREAGGPDADCQMGAHARKLKDALHERGTQVFRHPRRSGMACPRKNDGELLASISGYEVGDPERPAQQGTRLTQHLISGLVANRLCCGRHNPSQATIPGSGSTLH